MKINVRYHALDYYAIISSLDFCLFERPVKDSSVNEVI
jgi:hypothetical protein